MEICSVRLTSLPCCRCISAARPGDVLACDHRQEVAKESVSLLKARLRPMRGRKQQRSARAVIAGHGFVQNLRRGHYELAVEEPAGLRVAVAFDELALTI